MEIVPYFLKGQLVRMKQSDELKNYYGLNEAGAIQTFKTIPEKMTYLCGLEAVITKIEDDGTCKLSFKDFELPHKWTFSLDMIRPVEISFQEKYKTAPIVTFGEDVPEDTSLKQETLLYRKKMKNRYEIPLMKEEYVVKMRSGAFAQAVETEYGLSFEFLNTDIIIPISSYDGTLKIRTGGDEFDIVAIYESLDGNNQDGRNLIWEE